LVIDRSTAAPTVTVALLELFAGTGSVTPAGTDAVAVLLSVPAGTLDPTVPLIVMVTDDPTGRFAVVLITLPLPDAAPHVAPADGAQVQVTPTSWDGTESKIVAPVTFDGPLLVTTTE
jgi:hypothetical protein